MSIGIEAVASANEIAGIGRGRDPEALFEILEVRALDVEIALEEAGVPDERIQVAGAPAWAFEDLLDDDPDFLERYWRGRSDREAGVYVQVEDARVTRRGQYVRIWDGRTDGDRLVVVAVGSDGGVWRSFDDGARWVASEVVGTQNFRSLAQDSTGFVVVGAEDTIRRLQADG